MSDRSAATALSRLRRRLFGRSREDLLRSWQRAVLRYYADNRPVKR